MHYILFYDVVPDYVKLREKYRESHLAVGTEFFKRGDLVLAGALADPVDQAVIVFSSLTAAEDFLKADPYFLNGLVKSYRIRKWTTVLGMGITTTED
jgi:hypothetical protein